MRVSGAADAGALKNGTLVFFPWIQRVLSRIHTCQH